MGAESFFIEEQKKLRKMEITEVAFWYLFFRLCITFTKVFDFLLTQLCILPQLVSREGIKSNVS